MGDLVPEIHRPGPVAEEHHVRLLRRRQRLQPVDRAARGVDQEHVGVNGGGCRGLCVAADAGQGQHFHAEIGLGGQLLQFLFNALGLLVHVGRGLQTAVGPPTGRLAPLMELPDQHRLYSQLHACAEVHGRRGLRRNGARHRRGHHGHAAECRRPAQELAAADAVADPFCPTATRTARRSSFVMVFDVLGLHGSILPFEGLGSPHTSSLSQNE